MSKNEQHKTNREPISFADWWRRRGFSDNPFVYASAEDVRDDLVPELLGQWYVDPDPSHAEGTPTLDKVISFNDRPLGLVYAKRGSGKTFYRRWATRQIIELEELLSPSVSGGLKSRWAIEIPNLRAEVNLNRVTSEDLARSVYRHVYCYAHGRDPPPPPAENDTAQILHACDEVLRQEPPERSVSRLYVFVDGISLLFHERRAQQNKLALEAVCELCLEAARRQGLPVLLRIFVPPQLREYIQTEIGTDASGIEECTIEWSADLCWQVVETRLDACWKGSGSPNAQLLSSDLTTEIKRWLRGLQQLNALSPRCVVQTLDELSRHLFQQKRPANEPFDVEDWKQFLQLYSHSYAVEPYYSFPPARGRTADSGALTGSESPRLLKVFLCHASEDKPAIRALYRRLCASGVDPWLDEEKLLAGQEWRFEIARAIRDMDVILVCLSQRSVKKAGYVQKEICYALDVADGQPEGAIFVIPVRLEDCALPDRLSRWQRVDLYDGPGYERLIRALQARAQDLGVMLPSS